jgi:hypothetical protein
MYLLFYYFCLYKRGDKKGKMSHTQQIGTSLKRTEKEHADRNVFKKTDGFSKFQLRFLLYVRLELDLVSSLDASCSNPCEHGLNIFSNWTLYHVK